MLYESYEQKMAKIARFLKFVFKHLTKIIIAASVVIATTTTILAVKGTIIGAKDCPESIVYGEELGFSANAFLGKVKYEYRLDGTDEWSSEFPILPGTYNVRPFSTSIFGNSRYGKIQTFVINPKNIEINIKTSSMVYGGTPEIESSELKAGDTLYCQDFIFEDGNNQALLTPGKANVSPNLDAVVIVDKDGRDVTKSYNISFIQKEINVSARELEIIVAGAEKIYDGKALTNHTYSISAGGSLADGDRIEIKYLNSITNVGSIVNEAEIKIFNSSGEDVTSFYSIVLGCGYLQVKPSLITIEMQNAEFVYDGTAHSFTEFTYNGAVAEGETLIIKEFPSITDVGEIQNNAIFAVVDSSSVDKSLNYSLTFNPSKLTVTPKPLVITTENEEWTYDALPHTNEKGYTAEGLANSESITLIDCASITFAGETENSITFIVSNEAGKETTKNYSIQTVFGTLTINKRNLTVTSNSSTHIYNGYHQGESCVDDLLIGGDGLAQSDALILTSGTAPKFVGTYENIVEVKITSPDGTDVSESYEINYTYGTIELTPCEITIQTGTSSYLYDGTPHSDESYAVIQGELPENHYTSINESTLTLFTDAEIGKNRFEIEVFDEYEQNVTENFLITYEYGTLEVTPRTLHVKSSSRSWMYDALPHSETGYELSLDGLAPEQTFEIVNHITLTDVDLKDNFFTFAIKDKNGNDVTHNYSSTFESGTILVYAREVVLTTANDEKVYDGTPLENSNVTVSGESLNDLVIGHTVALTVTGSITNAGSTPNIFDEASFKILDENGKDVTHNYSPTLITGTLRVKQRKLDLETETFSKVYDDTAAFVHIIKVLNTATDEGLAKNHTIEAYGWASITNVGCISNSFDSFEIFNFGEIIDKNNYDITLSFGTLEVTPRPLTVQIASYTWVYDDSTHSYEQYQITNTKETEGLVLGHVFTPIDWSVAGPDAGEYKNTFHRHTIEREDGTNVLSNYDVTIENGTLEITKRKISISTGSFSIVYDGQGHSLKEYTITSTASDEGLVLGHVIYLSGWRTISEVSESCTNSAIVKIFREGTTYPSLQHNYNIIMDLGRLEIVKRKIDITTGSAEFLYDGTPHEYNFWEITSTEENEGLAPDQTLHGTPIGYTDAGTYDNEILFSISSHGGTKETTDNYEINVTNGTVTVTPRLLNLLTGSDIVTYDGYYHSNENVLYIGGDGLAPYQTLEVTQITNVKDAGTYQNILMFDIVSDLSGESVKHNYEIYVEYGYITINKRNITITTATNSWEYDGKEHSEKSAWVSQNTLADYEEILIKNYNKITDVGIIINWIEISIITKNYEDVTQNYNIGWIFGELTVTPRRITVITGSDEKVYDATPLTSDKITVDASSPNPLVETHSLVGSASGSITNVGMISNPYSGEVIILDKNGKQVTSNYDITYLEGTLTVKERPMAFYSIGANKVYDDTPLTNHEAYITKGSLAPALGHKVQFFFTGSITNAGIEENSFTVAIYDEMGIDVSYNYDFSYIYGALTVQKRPIYVETESAAKLFDNTPLTAPHIFVTEKSPYPLVLGHIILANVTGSITLPGSVPNTVDFNSIKIYDRSGTVDLTDNYSIESVTEGTLVVTSFAEIIVYTYDATQIYNGLALTNTYYDIWVSSDTGDAIIEVEVVGSLTNVGTVKNDVVVRVYYPDGRDITNHCAITKHLGTLTVLPRELTVKTANASFLYDGTAKNCIEYEIISGTFAQGQYATIASYASSVNVSNVPNKLTLSITDTYGANYTDNYKITYEYGTLEITPRYLSFQRKGGLWVYDAKPHSNSTLTLMGGDGIAPGQFAEPCNVTEITNVGIVNNLVKARIVTNDPDYGKIDVSENYIITYTNAELEVVKRTIRISSVSKAKIYDGTPLQAPELMVDGNSPNGLVRTHTLSAAGFASITNIGVIPNSFDLDSVRITDEIGMDVTRNYNIESITFGTLTVTDMAKITVITESDSKFYDGTPLTNDLYQVQIEGIFPDDCWLNITVTGTITEVGKVSNGAIVRVINSFDKDVTEDFAIEIIPGTLQIFASDDASDDDGSEGGSGSGGSGSGGGAGGSGGSSSSMLDTSGSTGGGGGKNGEKLHESLGQKVVYYLDSNVNATVYLKVLSYGDYYSSAAYTWGYAPIYSDWIFSSYPASYLTSFALQNEGFGQFSVTITPDSVANFAIPYFASDLNLNTNYWDIGSDQAVSNAYDVSFFVWNYNSALGVKVPVGLSEYEEKYREFVYANYLGIDDKTLEFLNTIISDMGFDKNDPYIISAVAEYIQGAAEYDLNYPIALNSSDNVVIDFLSVHQRGVCRHYATAATMLYRALGIPARYTIGFVGNTVAGERTEVTEAAAHAWVEVYIDGLGWVPVEVTGSSNDDGGSSGSGGGSGEGEGNGEQEDLEEELPTIIVQPIFHSQVYTGMPLYATNEIIKNPSIVYLEENGYTYNVRISGSLSHAGRSVSSVQSFEIFDSSGANVTSLFKIEYRTGTLMMSSTIIKIHLGMLQKYYDGKALCYSNELDVDYVIMEMAEGFTISDVQINLFLVDASWITSDEINNDITSYLSYKLYYNGEEISPSDASVVIVNEDGLEEGYTLIKIDPREITVCSYSASKEYDNEPLSNGLSYISQGSLVDGDKLEALIDTEILDVGKVTNTIKNVTIIDMNGNDVTQNYKIQKNEGILEITPN